MKLSLFFLFFSFFALTQEPDTLRFYFDVNEDQNWQLNSQAQQIFKTLDRNSRIVAIEAHCDIRASETYNQRLSERRLKTVSSQLESSGFTIENAQKNAFGESRAASSGLTMDECRRVDVLYIEPVIDVAEPISEIAVVEEIESGGQLTEDAFSNFIKNDVQSLDFDLTILFVNVSTQVLPESQPKLEELLEIMKEHPNLNAKFHGHVCCGPNFELSEGRARAICIYLLENGIARERLSFEGHSDSLPKVWPELTDADRKANRRVTVTFTKS